MREHEITAIPKEIDDIAIDDSIVTLEAAGCQKRSPSIACPHRIPGVLADLVSDSTQAAYLMNASDPSTSQQRSSNPAQSHRLRSSDWRHHSIDRPMVFPNLRSSTLEIATSTTTNFLRSHHTAPSLDSDVGGSHNWTSYL
ncbi:MAG: hypothetical protein KDB27_18345 [Planctomycetales bacterium]|nr:hypothetical protein [Planctomycetales bacterium]